MSGGAAGDIKSQPKWVQVQQKTFTRWCNTFLLERDMKIIDIVTDLSDGILLFNLLEILSGETITPKYKKNAKFKLQKIENLNLSFMFLKAKQIKMVNIGAEDVFDGKRKLILGLIWTLILRFQIQQVMDDDDGKSSVRKDLLDWCNRALNPQGIFVKNFEKDWSDGRAFAGLVNFCRGNPEFDLAKMPHDATKDKVANLEGAFDKAEEFFGFPQLLEAIDCVECPDELATMTYVSYFRGYKTENEACASKCIAYGPGLKDATTYEWAEYTVELRNDEGERVKLGGANVSGELVMGDHKERVVCKDNGNGLYACKYQVKVPGTWELSVKVDGAHIKDSPFHPVAVPGKPDASQCTADPASPVTAGDEQTFTVTCRDMTGNVMPAGGDKVEGVLKTDGGKDVPLAVADNGNGTYTCTYTPTTAAAAAKLHVAVNGDNIKDAPFSIEVLAAPPDAASSYAEGDGLARASPDAEATFRVITVDRFGNRCTKGGYKLASALVGEADQGKVDVAVRDNDDGTYACAYQPKKTGPYRLDVALGGANVRDAPFKVTVDAGAAVAANCSADGDGLRTVVAGETGDFTVTVRDGAHNVRAAGGDPVGAKFTAGPDTALAVSVADNGDGTYAGSYVPTVVGDYTLGVSLGADAIAGSPFAVKVVPAAADAANTTAEGDGTRAADTDAPAHFKVVTRDKFGNQLDKGGAPVDVKLHGPADVPCKVKDNNDGTYDVTYEAPVAGDYTLDVKLGADDVKDAPFKVHVAPGKASAAKTTADGDGLRRVVAGTEGTFDVTVRDANNNQLAAGGNTVAAAFSKAAAPCDVGVKDNGDGTYHAAYTPTKVGAYTLGVTLDGAAIADSPFSVEVVPAAASAKNTTASGDGLSKAVAGVPNGFDVQTRDAFDNPCADGGAPIAAEIVAADGGATHPCKVTDNGDGTYRVDYDGIGKVGDYQVHVTLGGEPIKDCPAALTVSPNTDDISAANSYADGDGLKRVVAGETGAFTVQIVDSFGNEVRTGGAKVAAYAEGPRAYKCDVTDNGDGTYAGAYVPTKTGDYKLHVAVNGGALGKSPFAVAVVPAAAHGPSSFAKGRGLTRATVATPGKEGEFVVTARDRFKNVCVDGGAALTVALSGPESITGEVKDNGDGTYACAYDIEKAGDYKMDVQIGGEHVAKSPFTVVARPGATHVANTEVVASNKAADAGKNVVTLQLKDVKGNKRHKGGDKVMVTVEQVVKREVAARDNGDGTFAVDVPPDMVGDVKLSTAINGEAAPGDAGAVTAVNKPVPVSAEHAALVKAALPASSASMLRMLERMAPDERQELVDELRTGLKADQALSAQRQKETAARDAKREAAAKAKADAKAAKKAAKAKLDEEIAKQLADEEAAEAAEASKVASTLGSIKSAFGLK